MLDGYRIEKLREEERDDPAEFRNPKHWHVFHVVAKKEILISSLLKITQKLHSKT